MVADWKTKKARFAVFWPRQLGYYTQVQYFWLVLDEKHRLGYFAKETEQWWQLFFFNQFKAAALFETPKYFVSKIQEVEKESFVPNETANYQVWHRFSWKKIQKSMQSWNWNRRAETPWIILTHDCCVFLKISFWNYQSITVWNKLYSFWVLIFDSITFVKL